MLKEGTLLYHWSEAIPHWSLARWLNFHPHEFACHCCGELYWSPAVFDKAQKIRDMLDAPLVITSGHRCQDHNYRIRGATFSEHMKIALDLSLKGHKPEDLLNAAREAGFTSFGFYGTFIHVDCRPGRKWSSKEGDRVWAGLMDF